MPQIIGNDAGDSHFEAICAKGDETQLLAVGYTQSSDFIDSFTTSNGSMTAPTSHAKVPVAVIFGGATMEPISIDTAYNHGA